jgi:hypothetical protein
MGVFSDRTSMDRIVFAVFNHENRNQASAPLFLLTNLFGVTGGAVAVPLRRSTPAPEFR